MAGDYLTVADELLPIASALCDHFDGKGFVVKREPTDLEFPSTPLLLAKRQHQRNFVLLTSTFDERQVDSWIRYGRTCSTDTRVTVCVVQSGSVSANLIARLRAKGLGLLLVADGGLDVVLEAVDLAFRAELPDRNDIKKSVRVLLGQSLDTLESGDWRTSFEEACSVLEEKCRAYLLAKIRLAPVETKHGNKSQVISASKVAKMPLGALKDVFCRLKKQNQVEAQMCTALKRLNPDRIRKTHSRSKPSSEAALRRRAGPHMWLIINALGAIVP